MVDHASPLSLSASYQCSSQEEDIMPGTTTFGGGPSLDQRRDFAGLKDGSHVPGYRGYCPQIKYRNGKTYGQDTHELSKGFDHTHPVAPITPVTKPPLKNDLPNSTGDNKYTQQMVPGYTGYIPRWPFKFGGTYKEDCDVCIDEHLTNFKGHVTKQNSLRQTTRAFPQLQPVATDPGVRDHLNTYRDTHPNRPLMMEDKRASTEPPIPGYLGYVPRIHTTELGLGCRYHQMTKQGLETFAAETEFNKDVLKTPITINKSPASAPPGANIYSKRLYLTDGMIPKYTGYLPQRRFNFGNTYGDTTRSLDVCAHDKPCYGDQARSRPRPHQSVC